MSDMYYVVNENQRKTYEIGTKNNARIALIELLDEFDVDDVIVLFDENSHLEDKYCDTMEDCFKYGGTLKDEYYEQVDRWFCNNVDAGISIEEFSFLFELTRSKDISVSKMKEYVGVARLKY